MFVFKTFEFLILYLLPFLSAMKFRRFKTHQNIYFPLLSLKISNKEGIYFEGLFIGHILEDLLILNALY